MGLAGTLPGRIYEWETPILAFCWLLCDWAPWLPSHRGSAWLEAAAWGASHGLQSLGASSRLVTVLICALAVTGAVLRFSYHSYTRASQTLGQTGYVATAACLSIVMPAQGAAVFLAALLVIGALAWCGDGPAGQSVVPASQPWWARMLRESFPVLAAICFVSFSWQYNAQWLTRCLLIAAGLSLVARAALPIRTPAV